MFLGEISSLNLAILNMSGTIEICVKGKFTQNENDSMILLLVKEEDWNWNYTAFHDSIQQVAKFKFRSHLLHHDYSWHPHCHLLAHATVTCAHFIH